MRRSWLFMLVIFGVLALLGLGLLGFQGAQPQDEIVEAAPLTVAVDIGDVQKKVDAPGHLIGTKEILLAMGADGPLAMVTVQPGDYVQANQLLAQLGNKEALRASLASAKAELASAENALQEIYDNAPIVAAQAQLDLALAQEALEKAKFKNFIQQEGNRASAETLAAANAKLALVTEEVRRADREYNKLSSRPEADPLRASAALKLAEARRRRDAALRNLNWYTGHPTDIQQAILDAGVAIAQANLDIAELVWGRVMEGPEAMSLVEAEAQLSRAEAQLTQAEAAFLGSEIYAPFSGVILEVNVIPGEVVHAGDGFILLGDVHELEVVVTVIEEDLPLIEIGQFVELYFDARPDVAIQGKVDRIVPTRLPGDRPLYAVHISFEQILEGLVPGMTADASIITACAEDVLRLPKSLVRARSGGSAKVEVWVDGHRDERTVQVGLRGEAYVEILGGLQVGDQVIAE